MVVKSTGNCPQKCPDHSGLGLKDYMNCSLLPGYKLNQLVVQKNALLDELLDEFGYLVPLGETSHFGKDLMILEMEFYWEHVYTGGSRKAQIHQICIQGAPAKSQLNLVPFGGRRSFCWSIFETLPDTSFFPWKRGCHTWFMYQQIGEFLVGVILYWARLNKLLTPPNSEIWGEQPSLSLRQSFWGWKVRVPTIETPKELGMIFCIPNILGSPAP